MLLRGEYAEGFNFVHDGHFLFGPKYAGSQLFWGSEIYWSLLQNGNNVDSIVKTAEPESQNR